MCPFNLSMCSPNRVTSDFVRSNSPRIDSNPATSTFRAGIISIKLNSMIGTTLRPARYSLAHWSQINLVVWAVL
jgi:hypothetical protein